MTGDDIATRQNEVEVDGPVYQHDCDRCQYLGTEKFSSVQAEPIDLYYCHAEPHPTLLWRCSSEGHKYGSYDLRSMIRLILSHDDIWNNYVSSRTPIYKKLVRQAVVSGLIGAETLLDGLLGVEEDR